MEKKNRICAYKGDPVVPGVNKKKNGKVQNRTLPFYIRLRYFNFGPDEVFALVTRLSIYRLYPLSRITSTTSSTYF